MNMSVYKNTLLVKNSSVLSGEWSKEVAVTECTGIPVVDAFLADDDIQQITVCSTNIGFVRTYQKQYL